MSTAMRWRVLALQAVLVLVLGFTAGFLFWAHSFTTGYVHDELTSQQISFPPASEIKAGGALDPAEFPASIRQYAGQPLDSGDKAKEYANNFIGIHLESVAKDPVTGKVITAPDGKPMTYASMGDYITAQKAAGASASTITALNSERDTMFKGEMLRGALLNAWGWSQMGYYAGLSAWAMTAAAVAVGAALAFEIFAWVYAARKEIESVAVPKTTTA